MHKLIELSTNPDLSDEERGFARRMYLEFELNKNYEQARQIYDNYKNHISDLESYRFVFNEELLNEMEDLFCNLKALMK
jgi:hypothetical protein